MLILINLLSTIPLTFVTSKTLNEYLHLSFGDERFPYLAEIGDYYESSDQEAISLAVGDDAMISIGCCSYQNGSHAARKYSKPNDFDILVSPFYVSIDDDAMCFLIFSEGSFPDPQFLPDFDYILPYPAPMKIDGVYQRILINWEGEQPTEAQLSSDAKIFSYFQNLLTPQEATSLDSTQLQYELYVSTFQFQYRPALMGQNGSQTLLQAQSINIFNTVKSSLYERNMGYERFPTTGTTTYENWMRFRQPLAQETDDPCGYEMIDYFLRDSNIVIPMQSLIALRNATIRSTCLANLLYHFSTQPLVAGIDLTQGIEVLNFRSRGIQESATVGSSQQTSPYTAVGLTGSGVVVGIADTGLDENSCYFNDDGGRVRRSTTSSPAADMNRRKVVQYSYISPADTADVNEGHGTHVCGTVAGNNQQNVYGASGMYNGVALDARLAFLDIGNSQGVLYGPSVSDEYSVLRTGGASIFTNSWGAPFNGNGYYTGYSIDEYLYNNMGIAVFFAAGNSGLPSNGIGSVGTITRESSAKNVIAVGASESTLSSSSIDSIAWFSSIGPTYDGRIKPDIVAPGYSIQSAKATGSNTRTCDTTVKAGTSMASPGAAGVAALIRQYFTDSRFWSRLCEPGDPSCRSFTPSGVLIKTIIIHSGQRMNNYNGGSKGVIGLGSGTPDAFQGFGRVQLSNVLPLSGLSTHLLFVRDLVSISENSAKARTFKVTGNSRPIKATLVWYDPPAAASTTSKSLINDLDLIITSPSNRIYYANRLNTYDRKNNVEQILISSPENGIWKLTVMANALPYGQQQRFSVSLTCIGTTLFSAAAETSNTEDFDSIDDLGSTEISTDGIVTEEDFAEDYVAETKPENHSFLASLWARLVRFFNY